jgi:hypothetical protein
MSYVTMPLIGEIGNLGSQIQQYFAMRSIAKVNNKKLVFPEASLRKGFGFKFAHLLNIDISLIDNSSVKDFSFVGINNYTEVDNNVFKLDPNINYAFICRFDLYHYWYHSIKDVVDNIEFDDKILQESKDKINSIKNTNKTISIHVRRGDYLLPQNSFYTQLGFEYYLKALDQISNVSDHQVLIFSNDIDWCKNNLHKLHNNITYIDGNSDYIDLCLMSLCDHNIIANSSFSWWGAYLNKNPNKIIVCPKNYLQNHELSHIINEKYYPSSWIAIE